MLKNLGPLDFEEYETKEVVDSKRVKRDPLVRYSIYLILSFPLLIGLMTLFLDNLEARFLGLIAIGAIALIIKGSRYTTIKTYQIIPMVKIRVYGPKKNSVIVGNFPKEHYDTLTEKNKEAPIRLLLNTDNKTFNYRQDVGEMNLDGKTVLGDITPGNYVHTDNWWFYKGNVWYENEQYEYDDVQALIEVQLQKRQDKIDRAKRLTSSRTPEESSSDRSRHISQDVMDRVWRRDEGKCAKCGSTEAIEFDHIIPFSKGGSNTYRNIQLLCEVCNRSKGNREIG